MEKVCKNTSLTRREEMMQGFGFPNEIKPPEACNINENRIYCLVNLAY